MKTTQDQIQAESHRYYSQRAALYSKLIHQFYGDVYTDISHPNFTDDHDLIRMMKSLVPTGARGLDAGCGGGARDLFSYWQEGYDVFGLDAVAENIEVAQQEHPEIAERVFVADLAEPLDFPDGFFDFVSCNAVIQHINPDIVFQHILPEFVRVLKEGGILQLMFKVGDGILTIYDNVFETERTFYLYDSDELLDALKKHNLHLIEDTADKDEMAPPLGGVIYFTDSRPIRHGVFWAKKQGTRAH